MTTNTMLKAAGASNSSGPHTDTNSVNFGTDGTPSKAFTQPSVSAPKTYKAAISVALIKQIEPPDVFSVQSLTTEKRIKTEMGDTAK